MIHGMYKTLNNFFAKLFDGGTPDSTDNCLLVMPVFSSSGGWAGTYPGAMMTFFRNGSGSTAFFALAGRVHRNAWKCKSYVNSTTTFTDQTTAAQESTTSNDVTLMTAATNSNGFGVFSTHKFNVIDLLISTASVDGADAYALSAKYSTSGGWTTLPLITTFPSGATDIATGELLIAWETPTDWVPCTESVHGTGATGYGVLIQASTAPDTTAAKAKSLSVGALMSYPISLTNGSTNEAKPIEAEMWCEAPCDAVCALTTVASTSNWVHSNVRQRQ